MKAIQRNTILLMLFASLASCATALFINGERNWLHMIQIATVGAGITLFFTWPLYRVLNTLSRALHHLAMGQPLAQVPARKYWPFQSLIVSLNQLGGSSQRMSRIRGEYEEQLKEAVAQEERKRLARDLHDSIKQQIFSINLGAATAEARLASDPEGAQSALRRLQTSATEALDEMDALLKQLAPVPLDRIGLTAALNELCQLHTYRTGVDVKLKIAELPDNEKFEIGMQTHLYRIVQEALSNIARHARAETVEVTLASAEEQSLILTISDDGQGFDVAQKPDGSGIVNIRSRVEQLGARLRLSSDDQGTCIQITEIPLIRPNTGALTVEQADSILQRHNQWSRIFYVVLALLFLAVTWARTVIAPIVPWIADDSNPGTIVVPFSSIIIFIAVALLWRLMSVLELRQRVSDAKLNAASSLQAIVKLMNGVHGRELIGVGLLVLTANMAVVVYAIQIDSPWLYLRQLAFAHWAISGLGFIPLCLISVGWIKTSLQSLSPQSVAGAISDNTIIASTFVINLLVFAIKTLPIIRVSGHQSFLLSLNPVLIIIANIYTYLLIAAMVIWALWGMYGALKLYREGELWQWIRTHFFLSTQPQNIALKSTRLRWFALLSAWALFWLLPFNDLIGMVMSHGYPSLNAIVYWYTSTIVMLFTLGWLVYSAKVYYLRQLARREAVE